jgi:hypothetical protein
MTSSNKYKTAKTCDFVTSRFIRGLPADFALAGKSTLEGPDWASCMALFRRYYLGLALYEKPRHFIGVSENTRAPWIEQIRQRCGQKLPRRGMFPPRKYFVSAV